MPIRSFPHVSHRFLAIVVTIVFWALLADSSTFDNTFDRWKNISVHALNTAFVLLEIALGRVGPSPWLHLPVCILFLVGYLGVAYITHATQGFYSMYPDSNHASLVYPFILSAYSFLDPKKGHARLAGYIIGIAVAEVIVFTLVWGITTLRDRPFRNRTCQTGFAMSATVGLVEKEHSSPA